MQGDAPTTARLERILARAAEVVIVEAGPDSLDRPEAARLVVSGAEIADLARVLAVVDGGIGDRCRCLGWPTILVNGADGSRIAQWALHHQQNLGGLGSCDAELRDGPALTEWLAERGLTGSREVARLLAEQEAEREARRARWLAAGPKKLLWAADLTSRREFGAEERLVALVARLYPEPVERIRMLLAWAGFPPRQGDSGRPWHELAPQRMLLAEPVESIFAALAAEPPTAAHLDGAAELFTDLAWKHEIPEPLRSRLVAHVEASGSKPMKFRMRHGYGAGVTPP
ncbi:hypothetical protein [Kutzneria buriramensis]|uniref:Uncharacterized protein n=1 Tax=Kutzneria buriramensis TaxID=1045776 RepID=A0A3E0HZK4_9PSEU|nr:hypothetical protein [Kutzneria buriramensis]REH51908.1 hypothetical protein BCF44_103357 [Kutzneria buriramensis]